MRPTAHLLKAGRRLHLQHGPIDLIIEAEGERSAAFTAARVRFDTLLTELVAELPRLRRPLTPDTPEFAGSCARLMQRATTPFAADAVTPMAAVAGSVADTILTAMQNHQITRAFVNNGGDIALHLAPGTRFDTAIALPDGTDLGRIAVTASDTARGIATSGWRGRSHSLGIADSVTVLARTAAQADVAATLIANAVDLPNHMAVTRKPANQLDPDSDLGTRLVVTSVGALSDADVARALDAGLVRAKRMLNAGQILGAALFLQGQSQTIGSHAPTLINERKLTHA